MKKLDVYVIGSNDVDDYSILFLSPPWHLVTPK